jgi:hypothetical protein
MLEVGVEVEDPGFKNSGEARQAMRWKLPKLEERATHQMILPM